MEEKILKDMLESEIKSEIENLSTLEPGSDKHSTAVKSLSELYKLNIEEDAHKKDDDNKNIQLKEQNKDRYIRLALEAASIVLPLVFYGIWMKRGFEFEKEGTYTSTTFRGLFGKFKTTKK